MSAPLDLAPRAAVAALSALGVLHLVWATGSSWPLPDTDEWAGAVSGRPPGQNPGPVACVTVAALLGTAAALVGGHPRSRPGVSRLGSAGVVATFMLRGALGLAGRTDLVSPGSTSARFRAADRRLYGPLCLAIAATALPAVTRSS
jgi:hypothetical protein